MFVIYLGKKVKLGPDSALYQIPEIDIKNKTRELLGENIREYLYNLGEKEGIYK